MTKIMNLKNRVQQTIEQADNAVQAFFSLHPNYEQEMKGWAPNGHAKVARHMWRRAFEELISRVNTGDRDERTVGDLSESMERGYSIFRAERNNWEVEWVRRNG
jgi:hypothetical protein